MDEELKALLERYGGVAVRCIGSIPLRGFGWVKTYRIEFKSQEEARKFALLAQLEDDPHLIDTWENVATFGKV